jgi:hypothetical protein
LNNLINSQFLFLMNFGDRRSEAQAILKEATKLSAPSFLGMRLKGDWTQATPMFERAALLFRVSLYFNGHTAQMI